MVLQGKIIGFSAWGSHAKWALRPLFVSVSEELTGMKHNSSFAVASTCYTNEPHAKARIVLQNKAKTDEKAEFIGNK